MAAEELLGLLNERLHIDVGEDSADYTMDQLRTELLQLATKAAPAGDWASLRRTLADARRAGVLGTITRQMIDDFAVVFSLTPAQVTRLKDVVLEAGQRGRKGGC